MGHGQKEHKGQPSASNKSEGTGLSPTMQNQDLQEDKEMMEKYMKGEDELADNVHKMHPNRNPDKDEPESTGGYKS